MKPGRNDPCRCGSGKKYKKCCQDKFEAHPVFQPLRQQAEIIVPKYSVKGTAPAPAECSQLVALFNAGRHAELESRARLLVERYPDSGFIWKVLGAVLEMQGKGGLIALQKAAELLPGDANAHSNLGNALRNLMQLDGAVASYRRALELKPDFAGAHSNLGNALRDLGQLDGAVASYCRALEIKPDYAEAHNNLGNALRDLGQLDGAVASYRRALEIKPDYAEAHYNLGVALTDLMQLDDAVASYRRALEIKPDFAEAHSNLGNALLQLGHIEDALTSYHRALNIKPNANIHTGLLFALSHSTGINSAALFAEHCRFGEQFEAPLRASWPHHTNSRDPERCLQIGFVSGDLRNHAVAHFIEPVLAHLAGHPQLSLHAYYNHAFEGSVTQRLRGYFKYWHPIAGLTDVALAEKIRADGIDILIDLSGHTALNRLLTFARKPAPVQVSWIGYPGTTGLVAMDYRISDPCRMPLGMEAQFVEKVVRLPSSGTFVNLTDAPPVNALPALTRGAVTFGSFQRPSKLGETPLMLWSKVLNAVPSSRMLIGPIDSANLQGRLTEYFAARGIEPSRLDFHPRVSMNDYLALHHQVDILLDTYPYPGGTTTNHGLLMGVPTLTMVGESFASWQGAAILMRLDMKDWIAHDEAAFVDMAQHWAANLQALATLRSDLRQRFMTSPLNRPETVARGLEAALRIMWQRWCAGLSAESFQVNL